MKSWFRSLLVVAALHLIPIHVAAQGTPPVHRVVMQLTSGDTLVHKGLMKQLNNLLEASPSIEMEVVCHGPGMDMLMDDRSKVQDKVKKLSDLGVRFLACENTVRERKLDRDRVLPYAGFVKAGILHIVERQEAGWSYIKAGF